MIPCALKRTIVVVLLACFLIMLVPRSGNACGPFFTDAIFVFQKHPDLPLEKFARGQLGVLQKTYARSYLIAAYRNLSNETLSEAEVKGLNDLWNERLNLSWDEGYENWLNKWKDARAKVPGVAAASEISVYRDREKPHEYESFLNCQGDSFQAAANTLEERIKTFGADSATVRDWVAAQDIVFSNCRQGQQIPQAVTPDQNPTVRADRAYQIAAANFYATKFDDAARAFDAIAGDGSSPWRAMAPYLAARSLLRKGSLSADAGQAKPAMADAEKRLKAILDDNRLAKSHHAARRLLNLTQLRLHPEETARDLAQRISKKGAADNFKQTVWDYTVLLDKWIADDETGEVKSASVPASVRSEDITDWVVNFQDESEAATSHAVEQWQNKQSLPWLVAAIAKTNGQGPKAGDLLAAAARVDSRSAAYPSLVFHSARLLTEMNRSNEARALLDRTLSNDRASLTRSGVSLLLSQRMMLAQNLNEFLRAAQREPAGFSYNDDGREIPMDEKETVEITRNAKLFFDADGATVFNRLMPVSVWANAAGSDLLPPNLHRMVTQGAFMRAAMIDRAAVANQTGAALSAAYPETKDLVAAYQRATTPEARRFAAAYLALKFPGLRPYVTFGVGRSTDISEIDSYRDNWWCAEPPTNFGGAFSEGDYSEARKKMPAPEFLKASRAEADKEVAALQAFGTGPNYLAQAAINWATKNPADRRAPEALHLAVKATRYGCTDKDTGRWSKAAFDLLHRRYANTSWAKETPYWFKG